MERSTSPGALLPPLAVVFVYVGLLVPSAFGAAGGTEVTRTARDLTMVFDSRWCGGGKGGYTPIRVKLTNRGPTRVLRLVVRDAAPSPTQVPRVERVVQIDTNSTVQLTLAIPLVNIAQFAQFEIIERGQVLADFSQTNLGIPDAHQFGPDRAGLLVIGDRNTKFPGLTDALNNVAMTTLGSLPSWRSSSYSSATPDDMLLSPDNLLPENWVDYSALDLIVISQVDLAKLSAAVRGAMLQWVETGGTLIITKADTPADKSKTLNRLLDGDRRAALAWTFAKVTENRTIQRLQNEQVGLGIGISSVEGAEPKPEGIDTDGKNAWSTNDTAFAIAAMRFGRVVAVTADTGHGTIRDWSWLLRGVSLFESARFEANRVQEANQIQEPNAAANPPDYAWLRFAIRNGVNARIGHAEFRALHIPGVGEAPKLAFLVLISLFTIIIGPVNLWLLVRRKQLYLLVATVPIIALVTSLSLFGYAVIADGFGTQCRMRSLTWVDQTHKTAVSVNREMLYSGLAPSAGLTFANETAVFPVWYDGPVSGPTRIDWTNAQHWQSGWLRSRTMTQFLTITHRAERGRIDVTQSGERTELANGFEWPLQRVVVRGADGELYEGENIPAGSTKPLVKLTPAASGKWTQMLDKLDNGGHTLPWNSRRGYTDYGNENPGQYQRFAQSGIERVLSIGKNVHTNQALPKGHYMATIAAAPRLDTGLSGMYEQNSLHLLYGAY